MKKHLSVVILASTLLAGLGQTVWADHFEALFVNNEPAWAWHPEASKQAQHHTHGLVVFERIHGVNGPLPLFVVRSKGV